MLTTRNRWCSNSVPLRFSAVALLALLAPLACSSAANDEPASEAKAGADSGGAAGDGSMPLGEGGLAQSEGGTRDQPGGDSSVTNAGTGSNEGGSGPNEGGAGAEGEVPEELVGIWQETRASGGDYVNSWGDDFRATSGFNVQLRIRVTGEYYFEHFASGVRDCGPVSYLDHSTGSAVLEGNTLILRPTQRSLEVQDCNKSGVQKLPNDPIALTIALKESHSFYGGLRTYVMSVDGGPQPFELRLLHRPPLAQPPQPEQPADFVLGDSGPFQELQGLWVPSTGTDSSFFDPETGKYYLPELNGSPHQWLRFQGSAYETAVALQNTESEGVCKSDVVYYEQGQGRFSVQEDVGQQGVHFVGHLRLQATAARLIVSIRECGPDDAVFTYDLPPQLSYYRWIYFSANAPPESITMDCTAFPQSEWQSLLCDHEQTTFYRRE